MPITFTLQATLVPDFEEGNGDIKDLAISGDGNTVAIGSAKTVAQVFVYRRAGTVWSLEATIDAPAGVDDAISPHYALALSADGSRLVLGDDQATAVSIFARDADVWAEVVTFLGTAGSGLGAGVAISADGSVVLVGQPGLDDGLGGAALFTYDDETETYVGAGGFDGQGGPFATGHLKGAYGATVCLGDDGESGIATAPGNTVDAGGGMTEPWEGSFFSLDGQKIDADDAGATEISGGSLSGDGDTFLMSAVGETSYFVQSFRRVGGSWFAAEKLEPAGYDDLGAFLVPTSLSRDGNLAAISSGGGFWIMAYDAVDGWVQQGDLYEPPPSLEGYHFVGAALALSADGRTLAVRTLENATVIYTRAGISVSFDGIEYAG